MNTFRFWFRRRTVVLPRLRTLLLLFAVLVAALRLSFPAWHRILAVHRPLGSGLLIVEGWITDSALNNEVLPRFESGRYETIYAVGGPIPTGARLAAYETLAEMTRERLLAEGIPADRIVAVPAGDIDRDRTRASAVALQRRLEADGIRAAGADIVTVGTHARRTHIVFRRALASWGAVGVISARPDTYDPEAWWRSSAGFRAVIYEGLACFYTLVSGTCQSASESPNSEAASGGPQLPAG